MIREKDFIFAHPNREEREFIARLVNFKTELKKNKFFFKKKLVSLKRSCSFAAA
jgi:hypothetical protein